MNPARIASNDWLKVVEMLWSELRLIFKTSSVTPEFFYVFYLILSFSTISQSFKKIFVWEVFGRKRPGTVRIPPAEFRLEGSKGKFSLIHFLTKFIIGCSQK